MSLQICLSVKPTIEITENLKPYDPFLESNRENCFDFEDNVCKIEESPVQKITKYSINFIFRPPFNVLIATDNPEKKLIEANRAAANIKKLAASKSGNFKRNVYSDTQSYSDTSVEEESMDDDEVDLVREGHFSPLSRKL
ncbi:hypothetical protein FQR65_LT07175 [Abscondita terminalis]|nr:hypothetical protein FQR65_LT07175 [Abscondita terminalis]